MGVTEKEFSKEKLKVTLAKLFGFLEYDQLIEGFYNEDDYNKYKDEDDDVIINALAEEYANNLYPEILGQFKTFVPNIFGYDSEGELLSSELFYLPAVKIYEDIDTSYNDGVTVVYDTNEIYMLTNGDIIQVMSLVVQIKEFMMNYRGYVQELKGDISFAFEEEDLFGRLWDIAAGYRDEEDE